MLKTPRWINLILGGALAAGATSACAAKPGENQIKQCDLGDGQSKALNRTPAILENGVEHTGFTGTGDDGKVYIDTTTQTITVAAEAAPKKPVASCMTLIVDDKPSSLFGNLQPQDDGGTDVFITEVCQGKRSRISFVVGLNGNLYTGGLPTDREACVRTAGMDEPLLEAPPAPKSFAAGL